VSSFLTSLLIGAPAPLDPGDASGMNLWDLSSRRWWPEGLDAVAPQLAAKLPLVVDANAVVGVVSPYWRRRYGLAPARVVVGTGDNPSSLIGTGLVTKGRVAISLGTSNTVFGLVRDADASESADGHVFGAPTGGYMGLTCFSNGSIVREAVRDRFGLSWSSFSDALRRTSPGDRGALMLPWLLPEITPHVVVPGIRRQHLDEADADRNVRAVVEGQAMAMANHTTWMGVVIDEIYATGGASGNREILQVIADVFGADVMRLPVTNSACLGAALRARHADAIAGGGPDDWSDAVKGFVEPTTADRVAPSPAARAAYAGLRRQYAAFEVNQRGAASAT
jgi:xylulokinase